MKKMLLHLILTTWTIMLAASPAAAFVDEVSLPSSAETGAPIEVAIWGFLPDPCWILQDITTSMGDLVATIQITIFYDNPDGMGCPQVLVPYEAFPALVFDQAGEWTVQVIELSLRPGFPDEEMVMEFPVSVTGEVTVVRTTFEAVKSLYR